MRKLFGIVMAGMLAAVGAGTAEARVVPEVKQFMTEEIHKQAVSFQRSQLSGNDPQKAFARAAEASYSLGTFALRLRGEVGFTFGFGNVKLVPTAEFFWM